VVQTHRHETQPPRKRAAVLVGVGFLCLFVVVRFVIFPFMDRKDRLKRNLVVNTRNLEEIRSLKDRRMKPWYQRRGTS
jgi:type II secretory pathway component PulM